VKKYLALVLGMLFVLGFTASAFAIHSEIPSETQAVVAKGETQVTLGGEIRVRGWYLTNVDATRRATSLPADSQPQGWYDQRVRLNLTAAVSKNTTGYVALETGNITAGPSGSTDVYTWGTLNNKLNTNISILEAWILHKGSGLGIPTGLKIGHMPLALSEKQFLDHTKFGDDAIVFFMDPTKELHIGVLTTKFSEGSTATNSYGDTNGYVALMTYKITPGITAGINFAHVTADAQDFGFQNLGLHSNGSVAGVSYNFEFDQQFGKSSPTAKYKGWGLLLGAGYNVNPVTIRAQFAQGSGDKVGTVDKNEEFQTTMNNDVHYTQIYEYTVTTAARAQTVHGARDRATGIANTTYYRLGVDVSPMKDLSASVDMFILRATKVATGSKKIGTEYDLKLAYKIDKNLTYSVMAGYLDTQKAFEDGNSSGSTGTAIAVNQNKNVTQLMHALTLSF